MEKRNISNTAKIAVNAAISAVSIACMILSIWFTYQSYKSLERIKEHSVARVTPLNDWKILEGFPSDVFHGDPPIPKKGDLRADVRKKWGRVGDDEMAQTDLQTALDLKDGIIPIINLDSTGKIESFSSGLGTITLTPAHVVGYSALQIHDNGKIILDLKPRQVLKNLGSGECVWQAVENRQWPPFSAVPCPDSPVGQAALAAILGEF